MTTGTTSADSTMPAAVRRQPGTGLIYLVMAGLLWGTGGLTGSLLSRSAGLPALSVAAYRLGVGGTLIIAFLVLTRHRRASRRRWPSGRAAWARIAAIGLLAAVFQSCYFTAVSLSSVSLATLVTIGSAPVIVLAVERARGHRRIGRLAGCATSLALIGLSLLVGLPAGGIPESAVLASASLAVLAAAGFATLTLIGARPVAGLDDLTATGFGFALGGLILLPVAAVSGGLGFTPSPATLGLLAALGTGPTAVAYTLYFRGLRTAPAGTAALLSLLEPLTGTVLAAVILGDRLGASGIAGAVILAAALVLAGVAGHAGLAVQAGVAGQAGLAGQASGHGRADHGGGPAQHDRAQRHQYRERLPHRGSAESAGRQDPGGRDRVVQRVDMGQHPHPVRPERDGQQHPA
jgi:drug/metabolite transporter, DME family